MSDERIPSQPPGLFTVEHEKALDLLKSIGYAVANSPEEERILLDLVAGGLARKEGNAFFTCNKEMQRRNEEVQPATPDASWTVDQLLEKGRALRLNVRLRGIRARKLSLGEPLKPPPGQASQPKPGG